MAGVISSTIFIWIPIIFFGGGLLAVFIFFLLGVLSLFFTDDKDKGSEIILKSLTYLFILLIIFLVFSSVSYLVKNGEIFKPQELSDAGVPVSPMGSFPPAAKFIKIGNYNFAGPWQLKEKDEKIDSLIFTALCKNGESYDIIDVGMTNRKEKISKSRNYSCWKENCGNNKNNLYVAFYWVPEEGFGTNYKTNIIKNIEKQINLPCAENL